MPVGRRASLLGALAALCLFAGAATAQADDEQECVGTIGPVTVGNLVVPEGAVCDLAGTQVRGNVRVLEAAELLTEGANIRGNITAYPQSFVELFESSVGGNVVLRDAVGASVDTSEIGGNISSRDTDFIDVFSSSVGGNIEVQGQTSFVAEAVDVNGNLWALEAEFFDLYDSAVNGNFSVRNTAEGSIFCGNQLNGNPEFFGNGGILTIGSPTQACDGNRVDGNIIVNNNTAETEISDNDVGGNLQCRGNEPPPQGGGNRVEGNREGQCRAL